MRPNERAVLNGHATGNEGKGLDLDVSSQGHATLDLDEGGDLAAVADPAAVEVDQLRVRDRDIPPENDVRRDHGWPGPSDPATRTVSCRCREAERAQQF